VSARSDLTDALNAALWQLEAAGEVETLRAKWGL
jgi:ABC-type amino acid transport substrate-binding protein